MRCSLLSNFFVINTGRDFSIVLGLLHIPLVAQRVERWTCDQQVVGSNPTRGKSCVTTLGKLFTPMCHCQLAV